MHFHFTAFSTNSGHQGFLIIKQLGNDHKNYVKEIIMLLDLDHFGVTNHLH